MLFKSGLVTQVSGSIGGMTGSHNKGGFYLKARSVPVNPSTPAQVASRLRFQAQSTAWTNTLTTEQRSAWNAYAQGLSWTNNLGDAIELSGQNVFIGANCVLEQAALPAVADPPAIASQPTTDVTIGTISGTPPRISIEIATAVNNEWAVDDDAALLVFVSRGKSPGTTFFKGPYQLAGTVPGDSAAVFPIAPSPLFLTPFPVTPGDRVFAAVRAVFGDGRYSFMTSLGSVLTVV